MVRFLGAGMLAGAAALCACTSAPTASPAPVPPLSPPAPPAGAMPVPAPVAGLAHYRCDQGIEFTVRFRNDTALLDSVSRGNEVLLRDAGGLGPQQSVYSNARLRAEFGLGASGREAILRYLAPALVTHCMRD